MDRDPIFAVGVNNGDDTAYYLSSGFRVVGIEANPEMIAVCEKRLCEKLKNGRLIRLKMTIADEDGTTWSLARRIALHRLTERLHSVRGLDTAVSRLRRFSSVRPKAAIPARFPISSSGPRPDESDGPWRSLEEALYWA